MAIIRKYDFVLTNYSKENEDEFFNLEPYLPKEFTYLPLQTFQYGKNIFLISVKTIFNSMKIVGYMITSNYSQETTENKKWISQVVGVPEALFLNHQGHYIDDFYIAKRYRGRGIGTVLFSSINNQYFLNNSLLLFAAEGSGVFWEKQGFKKKCDTIYLKEN